MVSHGHGLDRFVQSSVASELTLKASCPILVPVFKVQKAKGKLRVVQFAQLRYLMGITLR
jgi:hypothetical protein